MLNDLRELVRPNRVASFPVEEVSFKAQDEAAPEEGGLAKSSIDAIWSSVIDLYGTGLHPGISLCIRRHGAKVLDRSIGHIQGNTPQGVDPGRLTPSYPDSLFNLFSASKSITAMLVHHVDDLGLLHIDDRVSTYIPEFAAHGKDKTTVRHVLNHRAGLPLVPADKFNLDLLLDEEGIVSELCASRPISVPGRKLAYHAITGGFILAEILRRVTGKPIRQLLDEVVREPLGMQNFQYGVPETLADQVADETWTGPSPPFPLNLAVRRAFGGDMPDAVALANDRRFRTGIVPSGNIYCTAEEASRFFEVLLRGGVHQGERIFAERTILRARVEQSYHEYDAILQYPSRFGLGFMLGSEHSSVFGPNTQEVFGHLGFTNVLVWADPERDISVALLNNGKPLFSIDSLKWLNVARTIGRVISKTDRRGA